jgi:hypothetical protein
MVISVNRSAGRSTYNTKSALTWFYKATRSINYTYTSRSLISHPFSASIQSPYSFSKLYLVIITFMGMIRRNQWERLSKRESDYFLYRSERSAHFPKQQFPWTKLEKLKKDSFCKFKNRDQGKCSRLRLSSGIKHNYELMNGDTNSVERPGR